MPVLALTVEIMQKFFQNQQTRQIVKVTVDS